MGYTHYFTQTRDFTKKEWGEICENVAKILSDVQNVQGIPLANGEGTPGTQPEVNGDIILFNGVGEDCCETFAAYRKRPALERWQTVKGRDFCKTTRNPYDLAVTAVLSYLATVVESHRVISDGEGANWVAGTEEARRALPQYSNIIDIPMGVMQGDRWCMPWVDSHSRQFEVHFCVDGHGYVLHPKTGESYCFESHLALAKFLDDTKSADGEPNIWKAFGSFDKSRFARLGAAQDSVLSKLFPVPVECAKQPPAFVRPGQMPPLEKEFYYFTDLLAIGK